MYKGLLLAGLLACAGTANAVVITLDADDFAAGTDVSHALPGVTLASYINPRGGSTYSPVIQPLSVVGCVASNYCGSRTGGNHFGVLGDVADPRYAGNFSFAPGAVNCEFGLAGWCFDGSRTLELRFDSPTDYVSFDTHFLSDPPSFVALDASGAVIASCAGYGPEPCGRVTTGNGLDGGYTFFELLRPAGDISRIVFGGAEGASRVGAISVSVPEPSTLLLLAAGLFGIVLVQRKKPADA